MGNQIRSIMSDPGPLILFYDYVDPASLLLEMRLRERGLIPGSTLYPVPFEVNPPPEPLLDLDKGEWMDHWDRIARTAEGAAMKLSRPWIVPWTRKAHELVLYAGESDCAPIIHEALFRAYLIEGRDIGRIDVLVGLAAEHGLDASDTKAVLDVDKYKDALAAVRARGIQEGVVRPPTLLFNGRLLHGYPTPDVLQSFLTSGATGKEP